LINLKVLYISVNKLNILEEARMKLLFIITTDDPETIYNAMRLANVAVKLTYMSYWVDG